MGGEVHLLILLLELQPHFGIAVGGGARVLILILELRSLFGFIILGIRVGVRHIFLLLFI